MTSSDRVFALLEERGVSAYKLSKAAGISQGNIGNWKIGISSPSYGALVKIANYFNVSVEYLECKTDDPTPAAAPVSDEKIEVLARAARKMTEEEKDKLIEMAKVLFRKAFDEDKK